VNKVLKTQSPFSHLHRLSLAFVIDTCVNIVCWSSK